jgi:hypothetical protein
VNVHAVEAVRVAVKTVLLVILRVAVVVTVPRLVFPSMYPLIVGVAIVGLVSSTAEPDPLTPLANTTDPLPTSSVSAAAKFALDGVVKNAETFDPSEEIDKAPIAAGVIATEAAEVMRPLASTVN